MQETSAKRRVFSIVSPRGRARWAGQRGRRGDDEREKRRNTKALRSRGGGWPCACEGCFCSAGEVISNRSAGKENDGVPGRNPTYPPEAAFVSVVGTQADASRRHADAWRS
jgi:hypothetical protein